MHRYEAIISDVALYR